MLLLLVGCSGQSGNEGSYPPARCEEVSRTSVGLDDFADGIDATPREVIDPTVGSWVGTFFAASELTEASLELSHDGVTAELVTDVRVERGVRDTSPKCPPRYEMPLTGIFTIDDGTLSAQLLDLTLLASARTLWWQEFTATVPLSEVAGTAEAPWDTADPATTSLVVDGRSVKEDGERRSILGSATWLGTPNESEAGDTATGNGPQSHLLGTFSFER